MERLLGRLERTLGRFALSNLVLYLVAGTALAFVLIHIRPDFEALLTLDVGLVPRQPWRLVTWIFLPDTASIFWIFISLYWTWLMGSNLEHEWGSFKLNVFYLIGALGTLAVAFLTRVPQTAMWINISLGFAFATVFPNYEIYLFFMIPIRVKWLAIATALFIGWLAVIADNVTRLAIGVALSNYFIFFGGHLWALARGQQLQLKQAARRTKFRAPPREIERERAEERACAICGKKQSEGADIRVCSCEKCGGPRMLCLEHARNH